MFKISFETLFLIAAIQEDDNEIAYQTARQLDREFTFGDVVRGVAVCKTWLLVALQNSPEIEVFHVETLKRQKNISFHGLQDPWDITASDAEVYISERTRGKILAVSEDGKVAEWPVDGSMVTLSLTSQDSLVACCSDKIIEMNLFGETIKWVWLHQIDRNPRCGMPVHAVKLSTKHLVLCDSRSQHHRLLQLDKEWEGQRAFGKPSKLDSELKLPHYLVRCPGDNFLVADSGNNRILLMNPWLELVKELIPSSYGVKKPYRMCLEQSYSRMFLVEEQSKRLRVFDLF